MRGLLWRFVKFGIVGSSGVVVNTGLLIVLKESLKIDYRVASIIAIECAIVNNYVWNSVWTWNDSLVRTSRKIIFRFVKFNLSASLTAFTINWGLLIVLTEYLGIRYWISNLIGIACTMAANFFINHFWVFRKDKNNVPTTQC